VTSYILTLREADTQLRDLVKRTQTTHKPVVLTAEGTAEPVALLVEANEYALPNGDSVADLATHLNKLEQLLDLLDTLWQVEAVRQPFPSAWRWRLEGIWHASRQRERPFRQLVIYCKWLRITWKWLVSPARIWPYGVNVCRSYSKPR